MKHLLTSQFLKIFTVLLTSTLIDWKTFVLTVWIICIVLAIVLILTQTVIFSKKAPSSCDYFLEGHLNELLVKKNDFNLSILHLNARNLYRNFGKFKHLLGLLDHQFSVIGISETWLNDSNLDLIDIPGYNFVSNHRVNKTGGGVGLYLLDEFEFKMRSHLNTSHPSCYEAIFAGISIPWGKNVIVGTIYRPPD